MSLERMELMEPPEKTVATVSMVPPVRLDLRDPREPRESLVLMEKRETLVLLETPELMEPPDFLEPPDSKVSFTMGFWAQNCFFFISTKGRNLEHESNEYCFRCQGRAWC